MVWISFALCVLVILFAGSRLAKYGDIIAEKTGLSGAWIGTVLLAAVTSFPELFTGISSVTLVNAPNLTVGNLLGANCYNLLNLALVDIAYRGGAILRAKSTSHRLIAWCSLVLVTVVAVGILISWRFAIPAIGYVGWYAPVIIILYLAFARMIFNAERKQVSLRRQESRMMAKYGQVPAKKAYLYFTASAMLVMGAGIWLAVIGDGIAVETGWGRSFVGSLLLAFSTTLPEVSVSVSAMRIGAVDIAIANLMGSNLFNMAIVAIDDLFYMRGPILNDISLSNLVAVLTQVLMLLIFVSALRFKQVRRRRRLTWWNCAMLAIFLAGAFFSFAINR